jgi:hypothetical protein
MSRVFVVQDSPNKNILSAEKYGELKILLPENRRVSFIASPVVRQLRRELKDFGDSDHILAIGDPAAIGIACAVAADVNDGRFRMLKWDKIESCYYSVTVDIFCDERTGYDDQEAV